MSKPPLFDLFFSGESYAERINMQNNETYTKSYDEFEQKLKKLCDSVSHDEKSNLYMDMAMLQGNIECAASEAHFTAGFKLGMLIAAQCFFD